jgi:AcrR family transcriptional regulator
MKRDYHHGHLHRALLDAGRKLVAERGVDGFTLREVARQAGVSHAAPYHHFRDKAALIESLAVESFAALEKTLRDAHENSGTSPTERLCTLGLAYVRFALERPAEFTLMNRPELRSGHPERLEQAARAAFEVLIDSIRECQTAGLVVEDAPDSLALVCWSAMHGLAVLLLDGLSSQPANSPEQVESLARLVTGTLLQGLLTR